MFSVDTLLEHPGLQYVYVGTHDDVYYQTQLSFCIFMIEDPYNKTENALNDVNDIQKVVHYLA